MNTKTGNIRKAITGAAMFVALLLVAAIASHAATTAGFAPILIDAGASSGHTDSLGQIWSADKGFSGGNKYSVSNAIAGTNDQPTYRTERWGRFSYNFTVPNGDYSVMLKFAETSFNGAGQRVFNVAINGATVLSNFDIFAQAGGANIVLDKAFPVTVTGGIITIKFSIGLADFPNVDGIQIVSASVTGSPIITAQPISRSVTVGQTATFSVTATGTPTLTYQWMKNGAAVSGATSSTYTTPVTTTSDNGATFAVLVTNGVGSVTSTAATLTVTAAAVAPTITSQPTSQTVTSGQTASFWVAATGTAPMTYQWKKNGVTMSGATSSTYTTTAMSTTDNGAQIVAVVTNGAGNATSNTATLTVNAAAAVAPSITTQPASKTVTVGQTASFSVAATGTSPMTYQWSKNGSPISGATSSSYTTPVTASSDNNAQFTVIVSNSAGNATSNAATLTVSAATAVAPSITTQPASKTVTVGQTASFSVAATGTSPMTYQWSKNGSAISGATASSYTTPVTTASDNNAQFTVMVGNSAGNAGSNPATLTVNTASTALLNASATALNFGNVNVSTSNVQSVTLTNAGNSNITISNVSISGAGFNPSGVSTGLILTPGQTAQLTVTFAPASAGSVTGNVQVSSNATNSPDTIALSGTGVTQVQHSVSLSWSPSTSTVVGYNAYSSTVSGGPYAKITSAPIGSMSYTDMSVQSGHTYYYVITSINSGNVESVQTGEVSALIP